VTRVVTLGEGLAVLRTTEVGSLAQLSQLQVGTGGAEGNVAVGLARLGVPVTWLGRVGDDGLGRRVARELRAEGVDVVAIVDGAAPTGLLLKESPTPGSTVITYHRAGSAGSRLTPDDLALLPLQQGDVLHLTGITPALSASARATVFAALDLADAVGATISYDVNHRSRLWSTEEAMPVHREIAARAHLLFASDDEVELLGGVEAPELVITRGAAGASALRDGRLVEQAAVPLASVVDTVGAGDAFVAGYLAELVSGSSVEQRLLTGVRTGAAACLHPGDWEGAATRADLAAVAGGDPVQR
jgi:2-dehydro-3-deoxygluconokinase